MEKFPINRRRLDWCRENYHIELDELAARAGVKPDLLHRAHRGEKTLTAKQLWSLGRAVDLEMSFFMDRGEVPQREMRRPQFRAAACRPRPSTELMMLLGRVERHRGYFDGLLEDSPRWKARKIAYPRLRPGSGWARKAQAVRQWLAIDGDAGFAELRARIEDKGVMVFVSNSLPRWEIPVNDRGEEQFKGFALRHDVLPVIFVAKERDERDQSFTLMHELAHLILHKVDALDGEESLDALRRENRQELEANTLAGYILLSDEARREVDALRLENKDVRKAGRALDRMRQRHGVSKAAVLAYIAASKGVTASVREWAASQAGGKLPKKVVKTDRATKIWDIYGRRYVSEVLEAQASQRITTHKALVYMNADLDTFQAMAKKKTP